MRTWMQRGIDARPWRAVTLFAAAYCAAALLGQALARESGPYATVWPPAGLYLAVLVLAPQSRWPLLLLGAAIGSFVFDALINGRPLVLSLGFWIAHTAGAAVAAWLIGASLRDQFRLDDLRSMLSLAINGAVIGPLIAATAGACFLKLQYGLPLASSWNVLLVAYALGVLLVAPLLLARRPAGQPQRRPGLSLEALLWGVLMVAGTWLVFTNQADGLHPYLLLPLLLWAAIRFGVFGAAVATSTLALFGIAFASRGYGYYGDLDSTYRLVVLQPQLAMFGFTTLLVAVLFRQQQQTLHELREANAHLEARVVERTRALAASEAQARLRLNELEFIYGNAPVGLAVFDRELRFVRVNRQLAEFNGLPADAHIGYTLRELLPAMAERIEPLLRGVLASGEPRFDVEICAETPARPGVARRWVQHWMPVCDVDASVAGINVVCLDVTAQREMETALRDSERRFRQFAEHTDSVLWMKDLRGGAVLYVSPAFEAVWGLPCEALHRDHGLWFQGIHPEDRGRVEAAFYRDVAVGAYDQEFRVLRPDGSTRWVRDRGFPVHDDDGALLYVAGIGEDVSDDRKAHDALAASEERFRVAAEAVQGMVYDWTVSPDRVVRSAGLKALLGFEPDEVPPHSDWWRARLHPEDGARVYGAMLEAASARQTSFEAEFRIRHRDGAWVWVLDRCRLHTDAQGRLLRSVGAAMNITDRRRHEMALAALADAGRLLGQQLEAASAARTLAAAVVPRLADYAAIWLPLPGQAPVLVVRHADARREAFARRLALAELPRMSPQTPIGRALRGETVRIERADRPAAAMLDARHLRVQTRLGLRSFMLLPLTARERTFGVLAMALADSDEHAGRHYGAEDLPIGAELARRGALAIDNAQLYQTTQRALAQLQVQDRRKTEFLSMLAHELRNPLTPIRNAAEVLGAQAQAQPQLQQIASVLRRQTHKMARLVDDLLDMARITHGKVKLERTTLDLRDIVQQARDTMQQQAAAREQTIELALPGRPVWVQGDALRLEQVFLNLLSNACKFGDRGDRIALALESDGHEATASVADHGCGIDAALLPHVFDLFTQDERTPDRQQGGLGIGLALARSLVEMHGGQIAAHSDGPGRGARFVLRLPLARAAPAHSAAAAAPARPQAPARVLIAEDNADAADMLALLLRGAGYTVQVARSGPEALALAAEYRPQVALLDIGLPGLDGFQVAARLRLARATADALIVAISGYGDADSRRKARAIGIDEYFVKPLDSAALLRLLAARSRAPAAAG